MRKSLLALLLPATFFIVTGRSNAQGKMKLTGTVSDSTKPLAYVTVRLFKKADQPALQTALSKENGNFQLSKPDTGNYILSFTHTGFAEKRVNITVAPGSSDIQVGAVQLSKAGATLQGVTVTSQRPMVEQSDDKIIFNVEDDPTNKSETAIDILRKTPFVSVDGEDNIKINGKANFKVLLNGKETSMFARNIKDALRGFPGAAISKIEVITTPSAKYDGEGIGGLINIITKKKVVGYNGTVSTFSRTVDKLNNFNLNGNAKFGKVGISAFMNYGFSDPVWQRTTNTTTPTTTNFYSKRTLEGRQANKSTWSYGNAELSYELDSLNTISLYTNIDSWSNTAENDQTITTDFSNSPSSVSYYDLTNKNNNPGVNVGTDFIKKFRNNKDREFSLRFLGEFGKSDSKLNSFQDNPGTDRYLVNNSNAVNNQYTIQADNIIPLKNNARFEGGAKAILRRASSDFQSFIKYNEAENYKLNTANTDYFKYQQDVISLYSMYSLRLKKSSFRFGARVEFTSVNGDFVTSHTKVKSQYTTLLPNIQWTNKISNITTLVLNYTKRLQRPFIWDLNPFVFNNDSLNISYGNPGLGPQTTHALSAQLRFARGNTFAGINVETSYSGNKILQYASFDPQTGITETTSLNIGKESQASLNLNLSTKITPKWSLFISTFFRYTRLKSNIDPTQSNNGAGFNFNLNQSYKFSPKFTISSYVGFWKEPQTIQTTFPIGTWHNVAFNYKVFKNKVNISLRAVNFLIKDWKNKIITEDKNFYNTNITIVPRRAAVLALTWNFGKLTESVSKKKGVSNDDILSRPAAPTGN